MSQKVPSMPERHKKSIRERRERERSQRIQSILDAAKKLFISKGYLGATMDEIALEAEISKPAVYTYFKTKDDLFFSLMLPVVEDIGTQLGTIEAALAANGYRSGGALLGDLFDKLLGTYEREPVNFRIVQLFQQAGLVWELDPGIQSALNDKGRRNFETMRGILGAAIEQGLLRKANVYQAADVIWGLFVGIVQLEDIKSQGRGTNLFLRPTLRLARQLLVEGAVAPEQSDKARRERGGIRDGSIRKTGTHRKDNSKPA